MKRVSLRTRLLSATLALVVTGLGVAGVATYFFIRSFLVQRVDQELLSAEAAAEHVLNEQLEFGRSDQGGPAGGLPIGTYVALFDSSGRTVTSTTPGYPESASAPRLPSSLPGSTGATAARAVFTAPGEAAGPPYRVVAFRVGIGPSPTTSTGTLVVAIPFTEVSDTLHRLVWVEVAVAAGVVVAIGAGGWWLVRRGLRPLDRMAATADAITAGDLSRRVEPEDEDTEVGRLGRALNVMLGRIEASFQEQHASEERLRRFIADASHELRTPITSIRGYAELFRRGASVRPDDLERAMRRIEDEGARMGVLVEDLLLLARLDQGRPLDLETVSLTGLVADAVEDARAAGSSRPFEVSATGDEVLVSGDEPRLRQVLANLLENARVHTPPFTPVAVRLRREDDQAVIEVSDRGPGLTQDEAAHVFERFYRGDPSRARASGGTGLGLSIAAAVVEAHGGRISVASAAGEGATFTVRLPLAPQPVGAPGFVP
jgi:two-component system OmpR family sensor kinase